MDEDLSFCLFKFAEEQKQLYDDERQAQEEAHQNHLSLIKDKEQKVLREKEVILELFAKQLVSNTENLELTMPEILQILQQHIDSEETRVKQTFDSKQAQLILWIEEKQLEQPNIVNELELFNFNQTFETQKNDKIKEIYESRRTELERIENRKTYLNEHAQEILQWIKNRFSDPSDHDNHWRINIQGWLNEILQLDNSPNTLHSDTMGAQNVNTSFTYRLANASIQRISKIILDSNAYKEERIEDFKKKMEKIFIDEEIEYNRMIDGQICQPNDGEHLTFNSTFDQSAEIRTGTIFSSNEVSELIKTRYSEYLKEALEEIIAVLESTDTDCIPNKIREWLEKQSNSRRKRYEEYRQAHEEEQAQHLATDQAHIIELACALNQLAINSENANEFLDKLQNEEKRIADKHQELRSSAKKIAVPVIVRQIDDLNVHKLSVSIRFNQDFDQWIEDLANNIPKLKLSIQSQFGLPENAYEIISIKRGSVIVDCHIKPPHGLQVFQQLRAGGVSSVGDFDTISITLGELDLNVKQEKMNERYNRLYGKRFGGTNWNIPLMRGGKPYFCPAGWRRFGIRVASTKEEFERRWGTWHIAYHATAHKNAALILQTGLRVGRGCYQNKMAVYLSPSINYCAHYRYAKPWKNLQNRGKYYQMILQCRVNPQVVTPDRIKPQSLKCPSRIPIDKNFSNDEMEWIITPTNNEEFINDNIICYGIMIRVSDKDPYELPDSAWWQHTPYPRTYV